MTITQFLEKIEDEGFYWFVKRLSSNDTGLTGGHQAGIYPPKDFTRAVFPDVVVTNLLNPKKEIKSFKFPNFGCESRDVILTYYNNKYFPDLGNKKKYDECRLTGWGGKSCPLHDHDNTGSIVIIAISGEEAYCWIAENVSDEDLIEEWLGESVEPGQIRSNVAGRIAGAYRFPEEWKKKFPAGSDLFHYVASLETMLKFPDIDKLIMKRRESEFRLFEKVEEFHVLPRLSQGFGTVNDFIQFAHHITNRRKARSGKSLELNLDAIFKELRIPFSSQVVTENNKKPDFIFPSEESYHDPAFPDNALTMLAVKTCCKDRWRQILNEADRIRVKHLFTLQEGVSERQMGEMESNKVVLVVPEKLIGKYPESCRKKILSLKTFCDHVANPGFETGKNIH